MSRHLRVASKLLCVVGLWGAGFAVIGSHAGVFYRASAIAVALATLLVVYDLVWDQTRRKEPDAGGGQRDPSAKRHGISRAENVLECLALAIPRRIAEEDLGDALECIYRLRLLGRPRWQIWLKVAATVFWALINSLREITSAVRGRASAKP